MTQIKMAPEDHKPAVNTPLPSAKDRPPGAKLDEVTSPTEIKKQERAAKPAL